MNKVEFDKIKITGGFWKERQDLIMLISFSYLPPISYLSTPLYQ